MPDLQMIERAVEGSVNKAIVDQSITVGVDAVKSSLSEALSPNEWERDYKEARTYNREVTEGELYQELQGRPLSEGLHQELGRLANQVYTYLDAHEVAEMEGHLNGVFTATDLNGRGYLKELLEQDLEELRRSAGPDEARLRLIGPVLEQLDRLARAEQSAVNLDPNQKSEIMADMLRTLAKPQDADAVKQGAGKFTCTMAVLQYQLAKENPAEYVRIMSELVTEGRTTLRDGTKVDVYDASHSSGRWLDASRAADERRLDGRIFQDTFMEMAANFRSYMRQGSDDFVDYDSQTGIMASQDGTIRIRGVLNAELQYVHSMVMGRDLNFTTGNNGADATAQVEAACARGEGVSCIIATSRTGHQRHLVYVEAFEGNRVSFKNPWGRMETMERSQFEHAIRGTLISSGAELRSKRDYAEDVNVQESLSDLSRGADNELLVHPDWQGYDACHSLSDYLKEHLPVEREQQRQGLQAPTGFGQVGARAERSDPRGREGQLLRGVFYPTLGDWRRRLLDETFYYSSMS